MTDRDSDPVKRQFWENELETSITRALLDAGNSDFMRGWVASRTGRQLEVLCRNLRLEGLSKVRERRAALEGSNSQLVPYYLVDRFSYRKGKFAVADLAASALTEDVLDLCCGKDGSHDTKALLYALYHANPDNLRMLFHLDKIHKSGFARMTLKQKVRRPEKTFEEFLKRKKAVEILVAFDRVKRDRRTSQLKNIVLHNHHHLVFIRRPERPQYILRDGNIQHGHRAEWIILDFADNARRVNISSISVDVPLEIANALASAYLGKDVEYENESQITYAKQIEQFLDQLKNGTCEDLSLADLEVHSSPLDGVDLRLSHENTDVMVRAIASIERDHGSLSSDIEQIEKVKVEYNNKRIDIRFEKQDTGPDEFIVRYFDHRLNASARKQFEDFMRETHGIPILSTEKRYKRRS